MLSFGIRFGQGFDRLSILKVMQSVPAEFDYDFLVIGSNPGGIACAREARLAGKKTAIIRWQRYSPAEEDGFNENLEEMANALEISQKSAEFVPHQLTTDIDSFILKNQKKSPSVKSISILNRRNSSIKGHGPWAKNKYASRKVRRSRLDLNNEFFKRGQQCRKLMRNASMFSEVVKDANKCGWRVVTTTPSLTINWHKMAEDIMDFVMEENWKLISKLNEESVEIIDGWATFINNHTVKVRLLDMTENEITAEIICLAPSAEYVLPNEIIGAEDFGISCDDFYRMVEAPGKTLIIGSLPEAVECAGIIANFGFPVTIISQTNILKDFDSEISQMIMDDLKKKGVQIFEKTTLTSIELFEDRKQLLATFIPNKSMEELLQKQIAVQDEFDTVLFAIRKTVSFDFLQIKNAGITVDPESKKIKTNNLDKTAVPNIFAIGDAAADRPEGTEISKLGGELLGKRLFNDGSEIMDYSMLPSLLLTPTEYAFVGLSEDAALHRLGSDCVIVYYGSFKPLDFVIPSKNSEFFAKIIVFKPKDAVVGLHFYGPEAGEMIQGFAAAVKGGLTMAQLRTVVGVPTTKAQEILKLKGIKDQKNLEELSKEQRIFTETVK